MSTGRIQAFWCRKHPQPWCTPVVARCVGSFWLLILVWSLSDGRVAYAESQVVEGVGVILQGNQATARAQAIRDGLRKALEKSIADTLGPSASPGRLQALQARMSARTGQYIRSYRLLWEYPDMAQKVYRVGLEVDMMPEVVQTIQGGGRPRLETLRVILVRVAEKYIEPTGQEISFPGGGIITTEMREQLQGFGYRVVQVESETPWDGQESSALTEAREAGAGLVVIGVAEARQIRSEASAHLIQASAQVRLLVTKTRAQLAQERRQTTLVHTDAQEGTQKVLHDIATVLTARLVPSIQTYQQQVREQQLREQQLREQQLREQQEQQGLSSGEEPSLQEGQ